ncbi:MAG: TetR family transcriptional regulator [Chloroflexi bacterium]|nr:TetR family transcriptional regulator [Chloroflexota bacterium]
MSFKEREKRRREREILLSARHLIHESGYVDLNMDSLAESVGISKPTLYQHFKSKEELIVRVIVDGIEEVEEYLLTASEESPLERLQIALRLILVNRYGTRGMLSDFEAELVTSTLHTHPDAVEVKKRVLTEVERLIDAGKAQGEIIATIPTPLISVLLFKLLGLLSTTQCFKHPMDSDVLADHIDNIVAMFVRAIAVTPPPVS